MEIIIAGGGFCGALIAKKLDAKKGISVTLIDEKDYFEYSPAIHKVALDDLYHKKIAIPFRGSLKRTRIVTGRIDEIREEFVRVGRSKFYFDYLVIATGVDYHLPLENKKKVFTLKSGKAAKIICDGLRLASDVLIIGGGLIGVEIAGEISARSEKNVTLVHSHDRLLERNPKKASLYAKESLEKKGVAIIFNEKVKRQENGYFLTDKGRKIKADIGLWCSGIKASPTFVTGFGSLIFSDKKALKVNKYLQLVNHHNIFVGGDINDVNEEKTAQNAERHGLLIARNLVRSIGARPLIPYRRRTGPLVISLGPWKGILILRNFVLTGFLPGILKHLIEWFVVRRYKTPG